MTKHNSSISASGPGGCIGRRRLVPFVSWLFACSLTAAACGASYDRGSWETTLIERYGFSRTSAQCFLDGVESNGLRDRFVEDSVEVDDDIEAIVRACDIPIDERMSLGIGF